MSQHLIIRISLYYLSSGRFIREVKTEEKFKLLPLKVVAVAYELYNGTSNED